MQSRIVYRLGAASRVLAVALLAAPAVHAQTSTPQPDPVRATLPPVTVTAQKEPANAQELPVSLTAILESALRDAGIFSISGASIYAPNTWYNEFTARKLSNPVFRGIGSSPANPGVTTYLDGVPQLNTNSSSIELIDIGQIEFVRGPQSALFGRNALGGVVNMTSVRPSLSKWTGGAIVPFGNYDAIDVRANASGPISSTLAFGGAFGFTARDGFTVNSITGNDLDSREATFGKAQLLWTPNAQWEARVIFSGERARDGDYALQDLESLRANPYEAARDFEGFTHRDILSTTVLARMEGERFTISSTTGFVSWKTTDLTDLDYTPLPLITRSNAEEDFQFTQEVRMASAARAPVRLGDRATLKWQAGAFLFSQNFDQNAVNTIAPGVFSPLLPFAIDQHSPQAELDDFGVGFYGQGTATFGDDLDLTAGARFDHEQKDAVLNTFFFPEIAAPVTVDTDDSFSNVSPQVALAYRFRPGAMTYVSLTRGFKAGGFNPVSIPGSEAYGEEHSWNVEGGVKGVWADGRLLTNLSVFFIDWDDMQLNVPVPLSAAQFYIANVGGAHSRGFEAEVIGRPRPGIDLFGTFGYTHARFADGSTANGVDVSGNELANTPEFTSSFGAQITRAINSTIGVYGRGEAVVYGSFLYDESNTAGQDAYALANFRGGVRSRYLFAEAWVRNAFDTEYIPLAFSYPLFAPSGFVGEMGRPRTFGISAGVTF
jgi:iron complex outermembrane receptor protein